MKTYVRIVVLFFVVAMLMVLFYAFRRAAAPESAIIERQRNKMSASVDKSRLEKDTIYAVGVRKKLEALQFGLAMAYNKENKPDEAISLLRKLIAGEQQKNKSGARRSLSYENEARYYDALRRSYELKQDKAGEERAVELQNELLSRAAAAKRKERLEEGRSVGLKGE